MPEVAASRQRAAASIAEPITYDMIDKVVRLCETLHSAADALGEEDPFVGELLHRQANAIVAGIRSRPLLKTSFDDDEQDVDRFTLSERFWDSLPDHEFSLGDGSVEIMLPTRRPTEPTCKPVQPRRFGALGRLLTGLMRRPRPKSAPGSDNQSGSEVSSEVSG